MTQDEWAKEIISEYNNDLTDASIHKRIVMIIGDIIHEERIKAASFFEAFARDLLEGQSKKRVIASLHATGRMLRVKSRS